MFVDHQVVYHLSVYDNLTGPRAGDGLNGTGFYTADTEEGALYFNYLCAARNLPDLIFINEAWFNSNFYEDVFLKSQGIIDEGTPLGKKNGMSFMKILLDKLAKKENEGTFSRAELEEMLANKNLFGNARWRTDHALRAAFLQKFADVPLKVKTAEKFDVSLYKAVVTGNFLQASSLEKKCLTLADNGYTDFDTQTLCGIMNLDDPFKEPNAFIEAACYEGFLLMKTYDNYCEQSDKMLNPLTKNELQIFENALDGLDEAAKRWQNSCDTVQNHLNLMSDPDVWNMDFEVEPFQTEEMLKRSELEMKNTLDKAEKVMKYALLHLPIENIWKGRDNKSYSRYNIDALNFDGLIDTALDNQSHYYIVRNLKAIELKEIKNLNTNNEWQKIKKASPQKSCEQRLFEALCGEKERL